MKSNHCHDIDYLRIFGAISVLLYHYTFRSIETNGVKSSLFPCIEQFTKYGYLGVNLFFIISGFVILFSTSNRPAWKFAFARVDRLYPIYWVCVTISFLVMFILSESPPNIKIYFANLTMLNDYLNIQDVDGVYWTLHAELKFYFLIFLLVWTKIINKPYLYLPIWLFLTYVYYFTNQPFFMGWIISPFYSSFFISGISLYLLFKGQGGILNISVLVLAIIMSIFQTWDQGMGFIPHLSYVDKIVSCIIVFIFFIIFIIIVKKPPIENRVTIFKNLSDLTYPIYLIHASVGKHIFDILFIKYSFNKLLSLIVTIIFILIISALINRFIGVPASGKLTNLMERISGAK